MLQFLLITENAREPVLAVTETSTVLWTLAQQDAFQHHQHSIVPDKNKFPDPSNYRQMLSAILQITFEDPQAKLEEIKQAKNWLLMNLNGFDDFDMSRWRCATLEQLPIQHICPLFYSDAFQAVVGSFNKNSRLKSSPKVSSDKNGLNYWT